MHVDVMNTENELYRVILLGAGVHADGSLPRACPPVGRLDPDHGGDSSLVDHVRDRLDPLPDEDRPGQRLLPLHASKVQLQLKHD